MSVRTSDVSVFRRFADLIGLFSEARPSVTLEDVQAQLGVSASTAYRYVSALTEMGILSRFGGRYSVGPKIIELDYLLRIYDPLLLAASDMVRELARETACHVLLCKIFGNRIVNILYFKGAELKDLNFVPGRRMPLFRGSQARIVLAHLERRKLRRIYDQNVGDADRDAIGADWKSFGRAMARTRRDGFYISRQELDADTIGVSAPVFEAGGEVMGSLVIAYSLSSPPALTEAQIVALVRERAADLSAGIESLPAAMPAPRDQLV